MKRTLIHFLKREEGVTAVECALMLALVVVICLVSLAPATQGGNVPAPVMVLETE